MAKRSRKSGGISLDSLMFELGRLEARREQIAAQIRSAVSNIGVVFSNDVRPRVADATKTVVKAVKRTRRTMSAEARAKISAAQKARWAKVTRKAAKGAKAAK